MNEKSEQQLRLKPGVQLALILTGLVIIALLAFFLFPRSALSGSEGLSYLRQQETKDFDATYQKVLEASRKLDPEVVENLDTVFSAFSNSVIMGDSRAAGFYEFGFLPKTMVLAEVAAPISASQNYLETIHQMQPAYIFMTYGLNNMDPAKEKGYTQATLDEYEQDILNIQEQSPNSVIVMCALLPVTKAAQEANPVYKYIDDFNSELKSMAREHGWLYDSGDSLDLKSDTSLYSSDGEHFDSEFYPLWARNMLETVLISQSAGEVPASSASSDDTDSADSVSSDTGENPDEPDESA